MKYKVWGCLFALAVLLSGCQDESDSESTAQAAEIPLANTQNTTSMASTASCPEKFILTGTIRAYESLDALPQAPLGVVPLYGIAPTVAPVFNNVQFKLYADPHGNFFFENLPLADYYAIYNMGGLMSAQPMLNRLQDDRLSFIQAQYAPGNPVNIACVPDKANCPGWLVKRGDAKILNLSLFVRLYNSYLDEG